MGIDSSNRIDFCHEGGEGVVIDTRNNDLIISRADEVLALLKAYRLDHIEILAILRLARQKQIDFNNGDSIDYFKSKLY